MYNILKQCCPKHVKAFALSILYAGVFQLPFVLIVNCTFYVL